jgi:hypothetical protein
MQKYFDGLAVLLASAWIGGMWVIGYVVVPVLFQSLPDKDVAGFVAGKLFTIMAYVGIFSTLYLLMLSYTAVGKRVFRQKLCWLVCLMLLLTLLGQFGMQPLLAELKSMALPQYVMDSPYADRFRFWHGVSSMVFLVQSLLGVVLLLKIHGEKA